MSLTSSRDYAGWQTQNLQCGPGGSSPGGASGAGELCKLLEGSWDPFV